MIKHCSCGRKYDHYGWTKLKLSSREAPVTHQLYGNKCLEWRNCKCKTTLVTEVVCDCVLRGKHGATAAEQTDLQGLDIHES